MDKTNYKIIAAESSDEIEEVRKLFLEYAEWLGFSLCFQNFDEELATLPGKYSSPEGRLYLVKTGNKYIGCIGLRKYENEICEMKRLYIKPEARGLGIGHKLVELIINDAKKIGYKKMRLDTIKNQMAAAIEIYKKNGFVETESYYKNPDPHTLYMELDLN
jgi:carbonic anhydrase